MFCSLTTSKFFVQVTPGLHCPLLRAGAGGRVRLCPAGPESIRPLLWPLRPIEAPAKPGASGPLPPSPLPPSSAFFWMLQQSHRMLLVRESVIWVSPWLEGLDHKCSPSMILADSVPACTPSLGSCPNPVVCLLALGPAEQLLRRQGPDLRNGVEGTVSGTPPFGFSSLPAVLLQPGFPLPLSSGPRPQLLVGGSLP